jgi:hypothetical protein
MTDPRPPIGFADEFPYLALRGWMDAPAPMEIERDVDDNDVLKAVLHIEAAALRLRRWRAEERDARTGRVLRPIWQHIELAMPQLRLATNEVTAAELRDGVKAVVDEAGKRRPARLPPLPRRGAVTPIPLAGTHRSDERIELLEARLLNAARSFVGDTGRGRGKRLRRKRGRPRATKKDRDRDERIVQAWKTKAYRTYADLGRELGMTRDDVARAIDRARKRPRRN